VVYPLGILKGVDLGVPVYINIENAIATCAVSLMKGLSHEEIRKAIASFQGVSRRFDFHIKQDNLVLVDDYAHHPNEVKASIESLRRLYSDKKLTGVFQPHLYTRTRDFADEFAASLSLLDEVLLLDIYPAREEPIEGVTSQIILDKVTAKEKRLVSKDELLDYVRTHSIEVLATIGAGDINLMLPQIKNILLSKV
jgi:UDP-N-acetylmuramate--alanine ligase